jgi:multiple sugar transport system permease protein
VTGSRKEGLTGWLFASPWVIGFGVFMLYPLLASLYFAFCDYSVLKAPVFTGLENFKDLFHDDVFWLVLKNTAFFTVIFLPLGLILSLGMAMLLNAKVKGLAFYRTIFYLPSLMPLVATAVLFLTLFNSDSGLINHALKSMHLPAPDWLSSPLWSKPSIVLLSMWGVGNTMIIYLASLQEVPQSLYEAAELDGAKAWAKTLNVTLPMISPVILFNLVIGIINSVQIFTLPYVMFPGGAPARSTYFYTSYLYDNAFVYHKMGYACAMGWILFIIIFVLTLLSFRASNKHVYYGGS